MCPNGGREIPFSPSRQLLNQMLLEPILLFLWVGGCIMGFPLIWVLGSLEMGVARGFAAFKELHSDPARFTSFAPTARALWMLPPNGSLQMELPEPCFVHSVAVTAPPINGSAVQL